MRHRFFFFPSKCQNAKEFHFCHSNTQNLVPGFVCCVEHPGDFVVSATNNVVIKCLFIVDTESKIWASCRDFWQLLCSWCDLCRITGIFLLSYTFQFLLGIPESFPSHMRNTIALTCGSNPGGLLRCPNHLQRDGLMRILTRYIDYVKWVLLTRVERTMNYHHIIW